MRSTHRAHARDGGGGAVCHHALKLETLKGALSEPAIMHNQEGTKMLSRPHMLQWRLVSHAQPGEGAAHSWDGLMRSCDMQRRSRGACDGRT
jgi:hypothetical protein